MRQNIAYEKPPAPKAHKVVGDPNEVATVYLEDTGNKIDQRRMIGLYKSQGYDHTGAEEDGTVMMSKKKTLARAQILADHQEARNRLIRTQQSDKAAFGESLVRSGAVLTKETAQEAYERSIPSDYKPGTIPNNPEDNFTDES